MENQILSYQNDSNAEKMFADLKVAKDWAERNKVPIFVGEFGSYGKNPTAEDRCRHAAVIYSAFGKLNVPSAWWEWDGGFNMFEKGTKRIADCMRKAVDLYNAQKSSK